MEPRQSLAIAAVNALLRDSLGLWDELMRAGPTLPSGRGFGRRNGTGERSAHCRDRLRRANRLQAFTWLRDPDLAHGRRRQVSA